LPISPALAEELQLYIHQKPTEAQGNPYLFVAENGKMLQRQRLGLPLLSRPFFKSYPTM
jgi:hypothetical protein